MSLNAFQVDYTPEKVSGLELACIASLLLLFILLPIVNLIGKVLHLNEVETMSIYYSNSCLLYTSNFLKKVPAGMMIVPLLIGAFLNTFCSSVLQVGSLTTATFSNAGAATAMGIQLVCLGTCLLYTSRCV